MHFQGMRLRSYTDSKGQMHIFKHGTGDDQIANHVKAKEKTGLSSHQAVANPPSGTGSDAGAQNGGPPHGGHHGGTWMSDAELASRIAQHIDAHESRAYNNLVEGLNRAG